MQLTAVRTLTTILDAPQLSSTTAGSTITLTWSPPQPKGQSIIAGFRLYKAASPTGPFTVLTTTLPGAASFPDTLGTSIQYYRIEAFDQYQTGNSSPVIGVAPALSAAVKWNPNHYVWFDTTDVNTGIARMISAHATLKNNPNVIGYKLYAKWSQLEGATAGDYSPLDSVISQVRAALGTSGKHWVLGVFDRIFGSTGAGGTFSGSAYPAYAVAAGYAVVSDASTSVGGVANMVNFGSLPAMARLVSLAQAVAARLDSDPNFECFDPMGETSITPAGPWHTISSSGPTATITNAQFRDAVVTLMAGASAAFPHTLVRLQTNFVPSNDNTIFKDWYDNLLPLGNVAFGGPDPPLTSATGYTSDARYWMGTLAPGVTDLRGVRPRIGEVQEDGLGTPRLAGGAGTTPAAAVAIIAQGQITNLQVSHMIWNSETFETVVFNDILTFINANPITNPAVPSGSVVPVVLPSQVTGLKLFAPSVPGALYGVCAMPSGNGSPVIGFEMTLSTGEVFTSAAYTTPVAATACVVYAHGLSAAISRTATMKAITAQGKSAVASPVSNAVTSMAWTDQFQGSDSVYMFGGGSIDGLNPAFNDGYFDFATVRRVNPGDPTIASATVPAMNAPAYLAGFGLTTQGWMEVAATQSGGFAFLLNAWEDNPSGQNHNGVFNHTDYQFLNLLLYQPAGPLPFYGGNEIAIMFEGQISAVGAGTITFANQAFPVNAFSASSTTIFNRSNLSVQPSGYSTNTATTFAVNTTGWAVGDYAYVGIGDVNFGNGVPDLNTCVTAPNPGVFTNGVVNVIKIPKSVLNITGLFNNLIYKFGIGSATQTSGPNAGKGVFYVNCLNWSKA